MSNTVGLYRLQEFGISQARVSELVKDDISFEDLVKKVVDKSKTYNDSELVTAVKAFIQKLTDGSINEFQNVYMLRFFGVSVTDVARMRNTLKIKFVSDAEYYLNKIAKLDSNLAVNVKWAISRFKDWIVEKESTIDLYKFSKILQAVNPEMSDFDVIGQIMAFKFKIGVKERLIVPDSDRKDVHFDVKGTTLEQFLDEKYLGNKRPKKQEISNQARKSTQGKEIASLPKIKIKSTEVDNSTDLATDVDDFGSKQVSLSRLLGYGVSEAMIEGLRRHKETFFTVYARAFRLVALTNDVADAARYSEFVIRDYSMLDRAVQRVRLSEKKLTLSYFDSIYILNRFGAKVELLKQLELIGKTRVSHIVTVNGWLRKPPVKLSQYWKDEYSKTIREPVEKFKKWLQSGAGFQEYSEFLHIIVQQRQKYLPVDEILKLVKQMERFGVDIRKEPNALPKIETKKSHTTVPKKDVAKPVLMWKGKQVSSNQTNNNQHVDVSSLISGDVVTGKELQKRMSELKYTSLVYVKNKFDIREQDGFYFKKRYSNLEELALNVLPEYGIFDTYEEAWLQQKDVKKAIKSLQKKRKIFALGDGKYITMARLNEAGVSINDIDDFVQGILQRFTLFTVPMLVREGVKHKLVDLGFENEFLEEILETSDYFVTIRSNVLVFSADKVNRNDFSVLSLLQNQFDRKTNSLDFFDAISILNDKYGIAISEPNLKTKLKNSAYVYSSETDRIFKTKMDFLNYVYK